MLHSETLRCCVYASNYTINWKRLAAHLEIFQQLLQYLGLQDIQEYQWTTDN